MLHSVLWKSLHGRFTLLRMISEMINHIWTHSHSALTATGAWWRQLLQFPYWHLISTQNAYWTSWQFWTGSSKCIPSTVLWINTFGSKRRFLHTSKVRLLRPVIHISLVTYWNHHYCIVQLCLGTVGIQCVWHYCNHCIYFSSQYSPWPY